MSMFLSFSFPLSRLFKIKKLKKKIKVVSLLQVFPVPLACPYPHDPAGTETWKYFHNELDRARLWVEHTFAHYSVTVLQGTDFRMN